MRIRTMLAALVVGLALVAPDHACRQARMLPTVFEIKGPNAYTDEDEIRIGRARFDGDLGLVFGGTEFPLRPIDDPLIMAYLDTLQDRLMVGVPARYPHPRRYPVGVLNLPDENAAGIIGGYLVITLGEIAHWKSDDQGMMTFGHEIGHVVLHHSARRLTRQAMIAERVRELERAIDEHTAKPDSDSVRSGILYFLFQEIRATYITVGLDSHQQEIDADLFATQLCWTTGCDPEDYIREFEEDMQTFSPTNNHPASSVRAKHMRKEMVAVGQGRPWPYRAHETPELVAVRRRAIQIMLKKPFTTPNSTP